MCSKVWRIRAVQKDDGENGDDNSGQMPEKMHAKQFVQHSRSCRARTERESHFRRYIGSPSQDWQSVNPGIARVILDPAIYRVI